MHDTDPTGLRPRPNGPPDEDGIVDQLLMALDGVDVDIPSSGSSSSSSSSSSSGGTSWDDDLHLTCGEQSLGQDDSGEEQDIQLPYSSVQELLEEVAAPTGYDGDLTLGHLGWTCEYCGGDLTAWELELHGVVEPASLTGMCNLCYAGGLADLLGIDE
ncbi:E7 [Puffin papillomavirus 1]|uniref:E7 n=1 Tax=Puffin papillomavirus 1 TaxID=2562557 RepID=A0AAE6D2X4_9PAPI|nr:E7 [Puffin papillomavirus 1]